MQTVNDITKIGRVGNVVGGITAVVQRSSSAGIAGRGSEAVEHLRTLIGVGGPSPRGGGFTASIV